MKNSDRRNGGKKRKWHVIMGEGVDDACPLCRKMMEEDEPLGEPMILSEGIVALPVLDPEDIRELLREDQESED